ncbi:MAG TPA: cellulose synthase catalytic subunit [Roseiflexaceae bacterium]|nr:cellulose synthase catalytic subunit [Roseiflexaceae bacterium]HMP42998.1 cellulose synthase catalytic subunit [Roseiflexaceae bacterium]
MPLKALIIALLGLSLLLQIHYNTLVWPYLWPRPAMFVLVGLVVAALWIPEVFRGIWPLRLIGAAMIFVGQSYLLHSFMVLQAHPSLVSVIHFLGFSGCFFVMTVNYINQITPHNSRVAPPLPGRLPAIAAVIPTYGEPVEILERTVLGLKALNYPAEKLYILISDDGHRAEVRQLAALHGVRYHLGARKDAKAGNLNSALAHLAIHFPQAELILTQDADELIHPEFLQKTVGYFRDEKLAFVQTPKEAFTPHGDPFGNRDRIFYDILQPGRNGSGAAFSCGSGVVWRIAALQSIGGFSTWNIVEDMTTSYFLHSAGFRSAYHNEVLTIGLSPDDLPGLLKQRGTWAADTWRFFLFNNPLRRPGLTLRQRLQYTELGLFYISSVIFTPLLMLTPLLSLLTGDFIPIEGSALFPWIVVSMLYYVILAQGNITHLVRMWQYWIGHWPTYTQALWIALRSRHTKPSYKVTRKTRQNGFYGHLIWPQFAYTALSVILIARGLFWMPDVSLATRLVNGGILLFFVYMVSAICRASLYGMTMETWRGVAFDLLRTATTPLIQVSQGLVQLMPSRFLAWRGRPALEVNSERGPVYTLVSQASAENPRLEHPNDVEYGNEEGLLEREVGA